MIDFLTSFRSKNPFLFDFFIATAPIFGCAFVLILSSIILGNPICQSVTDTYVRDARGNLQVPPISNISLQDWAGWLLMLFSFSIVLMWKRVRSDTKLVYAIWLCIVLHHAVAFLNTYVVTVAGASMDARGFHEIGVNLSVLPEPVWAFSIINGLVTYTHSLGLIYRACGVSLFLGEELSVLAFTLSCVVLVKLVDLLDLRRFRVVIILLFGLLPSAVIFRSVTLRESWQALFFLLSVYWALRLQKRLGILRVLFLLISVYCLSLMHASLSKYAICLILTSFCWMIFGRKKDVRRKWHVSFLFDGLLIACAIVLAQKMGWFVTVGEILEEAKNFRNDAVTIYGRTTYAFVSLDTSSVLGLVTTIPMIFVQYMFTPFPWQVESVKDIYALLESMLRFLLLFFAVYSWRRSSGEARSYYGFLLIIFLGMELMWALGTINWGTAIRHHVVGYSVIVLLGAPGLILFIRRLHFEMFGCRKVSRFQDREQIY